ncbi:MAG: sugar transferase [Candidatus Omnitrophica bacterium]|nr:sugar transferase [Candidatus Omnitrophota bacterium]
MRWLYRHGGKRIFDLGLAAAGLFLFAVPMALIALWIWRETGRPILFLQVRVGKGGRHFVLLKFRTMTPEGRVIPSGRALRATAMDELPQLVNILKGEMSFVGPRPLIPEELTELPGIQEGGRRLLVRPGLAGLAQLHGTKSAGLAERLQWDLAYLDRCSLWLDLKILLKSVGITLAGAWELPHGSGSSAGGR